MSITLWRRRSPINGELARLREEMDRTFDRFLTEPLGIVEPRMFRTENWLPPIDVSETDNEVTIQAEAPGVLTKDLDIAISGDTLTISGKKQEREERRGENFYVCERSFGAFRRTIDLPDTVDPDKVTAEADNGVVTIHLTKKPGVKARHVEVKPMGKKVTVGG